MAPVWDDAPDEQLLGSTRREPTAFGAFYRRHEDRILRYFLSRVGDPEVAADLTAETFAAALASATGVLRSKVGAGTGVRFTPTLTFVPDQVPDEARRMEELLARTRESDAELARRAVGAHPAGDPDPYRAPREAAAEE